MKRIKLVRIISVILSIVVTLSTVAGATVDNVTLFKDNNANYLKYISGFGDGTVRPDEALTRAQCARMLTYIIDINGDDTGNFVDVPSDFWGYDAISRLSGAKIMLGYKNGRFMPESKLTRAEFATVIRRISSINDGDCDFKDVSSHWAKKDIGALTNAGYISGYSDGTFRPDTPITRAEAVKIINKVVGIACDNEENRNLFSDLTDDHWAYYEIMAAVSLSALNSQISHPKINYADIEYIEIDVANIEAELNAILNEFATASVERQAEIFNRVSSFESDVALAIAVSNINSQRDVTSVKDRNNVKNASAAVNVIQKAKEKRYKSLSVIKDQNVFEELIGIAISDIPEPESSMPDRLVELYSEEQGCENEFNTFMYEGSIIHNGKVYSLSQAEYSSDPLLVAKALNYYVDHRLEYGTIFTKLIKVRTLIANFFGYRYYTDLGYMRAGKYYYTPEDVSVIRKDIKKYIAPLVANISKAAQGFDNGYYNLNTPTRYASHNQTAVGLARDFLRQLAPQTREAYDYLEKHGLLDLKSRENKTTAAFTSYVPEYEMPFVFMNASGSVEDIENLCHEFGHALHAFRIGYNGVSCPPDVAEIASYGMEMLSLHYYDKIYGEESVTKEQLINFYYKLRMLLLTAFMDEFQYMIYKDTFLTIDERNSLYVKLYKEYFIGASFNHEAYNKGIIWTNPTHIFNEPYYSIDYSLALLVGFQLWEIGVTDGFDAQFDAYMGILESPYINTNVHTVALSAGLKSPFANDTIESFAKKIDAIFKTEYEKAKAS